MKTVTKAKILNFLGLFNIVRSFFYVRDFFNPGVLAFYKKFVHKDTLCFDVGANIGRVTDILLSLGARVIAIEPNPECVRYLKFKYRFNKRVTIVPQAAAAASGQKKLFLCEVNSLSTIEPNWIKACQESGRYNQFHWNKELFVEALTLDSLIEKYGRPDYLKIDAEGSELDVLKGLSRKVSMISLEICPETLCSTQQCIRHLVSLGDVRFNLSSGETAVNFDLPRWITATETEALLDKNPRFGYLLARYGQDG